MNKKKMKDPLNWIDDSTDKEGLNAAYIELNRISEDPEQPRKDYGTEEEREEIRNSIKDLGVIQPIIIRNTGDNGYYIISGHRRYRACVELGLSNIPAVIKDIDFSDSESAKKEILFTQLEENLHRKNLTPLELANTYKIFQDEFKLSSREIAAKVQKSHHHVLEHLKLLKLPSELLGMVEAGAPLTKVLEASKLEGPERGSVLGNLEGTSREDIRKINKAQKPAKDKGKKELERRVPGQKDYDNKTHAAIVDFNGEHNNIRINLEKPSETYGLVLKLSCRSEENLSHVLNALNKAFNNY